MGTDGIKILCLFGAYHPGYKAGGPIRSLVNLVQQLGHEMHFRVFTSDRDLGDTVPYPHIPTRTWVQVGNAEVMYTDSNSLTMQSLYRMLTDIQYDVLYLNSFFDPTFTVKPLILRRLGLAPKASLIVAPRGQFSVGALGLKRWKKQVFLGMAKMVRLYQGAVWQATSTAEATDIRRVFGKDANVFVAPDPPAVEDSSQAPSRRAPKASGTLKVVFLSRICRMKNLLGALQVLGGLNGTVEFDVYGPAEDTTYWAECQVAIKRLPGNIAVQYRGSVEHDKVDEVLGRYDLFFLPTLGENYGHVILEALSAGCPVLLSNRTPWTGLHELGVGWDLPLESPQLFRAALQECLDMDAQTHQAFCCRAWEFGRGKRRDAAVVNQSRMLFQLALGADQPTVSQVPRP